MAQLHRNVVELIAIFAQEYYLSGLIQHSGLLIDPLILLGNLHRLHYRVTDMFLNLGLL